MKKMHLDAEKTGSDHKSSVVSIPKGMNELKEELMKKVAAIGVDMQHMWMGLLSAPFRALSLLRIKDPKFGLSLGLYTMHHKILSSIVLILLSSSLPKKVQASTRKATRSVGCLIKDDLKCLPGS